MCDTVEDDHKCILRRVKRPRRLLGNIALGAQFVRQDNFVEHNVCCLMCP
jgi:hypothetical protein